MGYLLCFLVLISVIIIKLKTKEMKNAFKLGFVAFALSLSVAACTSEKKASATDSSTTDTSMMSTDTSMKDTMMTDTMKKDTTMNKM
ncbi:hypothetical protein ACVWYG_002548 [Pedobacter sp. UYEF25]